MIKIFSKPNCKDCEEVKGVLRCTGRQYEEIILETHEDIAEFKKLYPQARSVPVVVWDSSNVTYGLRGFKDYYL